jgi:glycosyltransferase involved in cell wall biosynthesis
MTQDKSPKISLIIPNFNNAKHLRDCLQSAVAQTFRDLEIIFVDDCSTDDSLEIAAEFQAKYDRIKIVRQNGNKGVSAARNTGLDSAKGEWLMFLDSDDCLFANAAESLLAAAESNHADLVSGRYGFVASDFEWNLAAASGAPGGYGMESTDDMVRFIKMTDFGVQPVVCWGKIFRRAAIGGLRFNESIYPNEDVDFMLRLYSGLMGRTAVSLAAQIVLYRRSKNSVIQAGLNDNYVREWKKAILSVHSHLVKFPSQGGVAEGRGGNNDVIPRLDRGISAALKFRLFFGRYVLNMVESMIWSPKRGYAQAEFDKTLREIYMAGVFAVADIPKRARFGLKLYISGLRRFSLRFLSPIIPL